MVRGKAQLQLNQTDSGINTIIFITALRVDLFTKLHKVTERSKRLAFSIAFKGNKKEKYCSKYTQLFIFHYVSLLH